MSAKSIEDLYREYEIVCINCCIIALSFSAYYLTMIRRQNCAANYFPLDVVGPFEFEPHLMKSSNVGPRRAGTHFNSKKGT